MRGTIPQVPEGTAHYKCAPLPVRVNPPLSKSRRGSKASVNKRLESGARIELARGGMQLRCLTSLATRTLVGFTANIVAPF